MPRLLFCFLFVLLLGFGGSTYAYSPAPKIKLLVSVDWEGNHLQDHNLRAMQEVRAAFPNLKLLHFLNAAYYTKPGANEYDISQRVRSVLRPGDEFGLHIHAWSSLMQASGVGCRIQPSCFWGGLRNVGIDWGFDVALNAYSEDELKRVVRFSIHRLEKAGFRGLRGFRAGAWLASQNVVEAIAEEGLTLESSAVPPYLLTRIGPAPLMTWLERMWSTITHTSQPYLVTTRSGKKILEVPDNGGMADYVSPQDMVRVFIDNARLLSNSKEDIYVQFGFHQESAARFLPAFYEGLREILIIAQREKIPLEFAQFPRL